MISYLKGKVVLYKLGMLILDVRGVGYKVNIVPQVNIKNNIVATQEEIELFVHEHIREDGDDLYGFLSYEELELFEKLISVNGVGPKAGINIMNCGKPDKIISAILADNLSFFTAVPGIGKKVSAKIILDLKSKLSSDTSINVLSNDSDSEDLTDTLTQLGYKSSEISAAVTKMPEGLKSLEEKVRWCLKNLAK